MIDLDALPEPEVLKSIDYDEWLQKMTDRMVAESEAVGITWDANVSSDPAKIQVELAAFYAMLFTSYVNEAARNQILKFSTGSDLDHLASLYKLARLPGEEDARLRVRIQLATFGGSVGGTKERFKSVAMGADLRVRDIATWRVGRDPTVNVAVLSTEIGGNASQSLLNIVQTALEAPGVLLVSDRYNVMSAVRQIVDVTITVTLSPDAPASLPQELETHLVAARDAETDLLGLDLTRAWVTAKAMLPGVSNVTVQLPADDVVAASNEAIAIGTVTVIDGGRGR